MKKSLKLLVLPAAMILLTGNMTSCAPSIKHLAMISDVGDIDDGSFNQGCWEAIKKYGQENHISYDYYRPFADSDFARECAIKQAVVKGAKLIIMPGFKFADVAAKVARNEEYKKKGVHFAILDTSTNVEGTDNLVCVQYTFQVSGWLAGYTVAKDYFLTDYSNEGKLRSKYGFGFLGGMSNLGVFPYGLGYVQGILYAAEEFCSNQAYKNIVRPDIYINYGYAGVFAQDDGACITVKGWLTNEKRGPIECVFSCGGKLYQSITEAVKGYNNTSVKYFEDQNAPREAARWIGVDADQYSLVQDLDEKKSIYTSALKDVGHTCKVICDYQFKTDKDGNSQWKTLRDNMPSSGFDLKLQTSFVTDTSKRIPEDEPYDYVGITKDTKPGQDQVPIRDRVLRGYNYVTYGELLDKIDGIYQNKIKIYKGTSDTNPLVSKYGEDYGEPDKLYSNKTTYAAISKPFDDSEYNRQINGNSKYPLDRIYINGREK